MRLHPMIFAIPFAFSPGLAAQSVPATINYQGRLTDNSPSQTPVNATVPMVFSIYDAPGAGTKLWQEPAAGASAVPVANGVFSVLLGASAGASSVPLPAPVFSGGATRYLQIIVNGEALTPRQAISATGYADQAQNAALAASATSAVTAGNAAQLGGVAAGGYQLATAQTCGGGQFVNVITNGSANCAAPPPNNLAPPVSLSAALAAPGAVLSSVNNGTGDGIYSENTTTDGSNVYAMHGRISDTGAGGDGAGVYGENLTTGNTGYGVLGTHAGGGSGVKGFGSGFASQGVLGMTTSNAGYGVYGWAVTTSGLNFGIYGRTQSPAGYGGYFLSGPGGVALYANGLVQLQTLGAAGATALCRNASNQISTCSSSLRYKKNLKPFAGGLDLLERLRPITFDWKADGVPDVGFGAEDVAAVDPRFVTRNDQGQVEGVKYDRLTAILVNAVREQQAQIAALQAIVCADHPDAPPCALKK